MDPEISVGIAVDFVKALSLSAGKNWRTSGKNGRNGILHLKSGA